MAYANFTAAWTAWESKYTQYNSVYNAMVAALPTLRDASTWQITRDAAYNLCSKFASMFAYLAQAAGGTPLNSPIYACVWFANLNPAGGAVTMAAILSAMLGAKFTELQDFIGIEDAYRVSLWNAPFNADFYAALARGFQKWP